MSFKPVLMTLCQAIPGARGAVFVDYDGECIQQVVVDPSLADYDLMVAGAHAAPLIANGWRPGIINMRGEDGLTCIHVVTGKYALVLLCAPTTEVFHVTRAIKEALSNVKDLM
jgi:predicted regulator of Ras-like GTPase activity (Roadblock/LC7/MglB family)